MSSCSSGNDLLMHFISRTCSSVSLGSPTEADDVPKKARRLAAPGLRRNERALYRSERTSTTRRFCARPSAVALSASGRLSP